MIETIRHLRRTASQTLADTLRQLPESHPSEAEVRDEWHRQLTNNSELSPEGWYQPPPHGIILAIGNSPAYSRINQPTFRPETAWPSSDHRLQDESVVFAYSSRVHRTTGLIGDFQCSLYRGNNPVIRTHVRNVWNANLRIADKATVGMRFCDLHHHAVQIIKDQGFCNDIYSVRDGSTTNIGHTIPWSHEPLTDTERHIVQHGTSGELAQLVSGRRCFISGTELFEIPDTIAFTIETRLSGPDAPTVSFHIVVAFDNGIKTVITEFDPLFDYFDMGYIHA